MTVEQLIDAALRALGVIAAGETPTSTERADVFTALNHMIGEWNAQALPIYQSTRELVSLTGAASYAISVRPVKIQSAAVIAANGHAKPLEVVDAKAWAAYERKGDTGIYGEVLWCDAGFSSTTVYVAPKPSSGSLELISLKPIAEFANQAATISLPPGYEAALRYNLAVRIAPEFGVGGQILETVVHLANNALNGIIGLNAAVHGAPQPPAQPAQ